MKLKESDKLTKKYYVELDDGKKVYFGAEGYGDYTIHKDKQKRESYRKRHANDHIEINKDNIVYGGFWAYHVLWGPSTSAKRNFATIVKALKQAN